jgi:hypothetical protein
MEHGFFRSLFDISFTSFITTKIVKLVYVVSLVLIGLAALIAVIAAFIEKPAYGVLVLLILAPLGAFIWIVLVRLWLEFVIQVFRITELLRDQSRMQRLAFSQAGWLAATSAAPTAEATIAIPECPNCGAVPSPGAAFCRNCGQRLV